MSFEVQPFTSSTLGSDVSTAYELEIITKQNITDLFRVSILINLQTTIPDFIQELKQIINLAFIKSIPVGNYLIMEFRGALVSFHLSSSPMKDKNRSVNVHVYGSTDTVVAIYQKLTNKYPRDKKSHVDWLYATDKKVQRTTVELVHKNEALNEFYPWIKPGIAEFQKAFLDSDANILLLLGEPGCGKTSFLRDMINRNDLSAAVTYDEQLMGMDEFFIDFINRSYNTLIIEDAEVILANRQTGNKVMNKLLNASDGLIHTKKKIVFTANLTNLEDIDPALIRPGRCFEVVRFRELTFKETQIAAKAAGLPEQDGPKTLSQLFAKGHSAKSTSPLGFTMS